MNLTQYMRCALAIIIILCGNTIISMDHSSSSSSSSSSSHATSRAINGVIAADDQIVIDIFMWSMLTPHEIKMLSYQQLDASTMLCSLNSLVAIVKQNPDYIDFLMNCMQSLDINSITARSILRVLDSLVASGVDIGAHRLGVTKRMDDFVHSIPIDSMMGDGRSQSRRLHALRAFVARFNQLADWLEHIFPVLVAERNIDRTPLIGASTPLPGDIAAIVGQFHDNSIPQLPDYTPEINQALVAIDVDPTTVAVTTQTCACFRNIVSSIIAAMTCCLTSNCCSPQRQTTTSPSAAAASNNTYAAGGAAHAHESSSAKAERKNRE